MTRVSFLGLGRMGAPMARRLIECGHDVTVWNRTASRCEGFGRVATSPSDAASGAEVVITMLADPDAVRDVVFASGLTKVMRPDAVLIDMSTIGVRAAKRIHETIDRGVLDAPVGGGVVQAGTGELTVLVGGPETSLLRARDVLEALGDVVHCGGPGAGQAMKVVFNAVLAITMSGVGEAIALGERLGLQTDVIIDVLSRGHAGSLVSRKAPLITSKEYAAAFALWMLRKDTGLALEAGRDHEAWTPLTALVNDLLQRAERDGAGEDDYAAITELFRRA